MGKEQILFKTLVFAGSWIQKKGISDHGLPYLAAVFSKKQTTAVGRRGVENN